MNNRYMNKKVRGEKVIECAISDTMVPDSSVNMGHLSRSLNELRGGAMSIYLREDQSRQRKEQVQSPGDRRTLFVFKEQ